MHTVGVGGPSHGWPQWVGLLVAIVLAICAATDYFARTITQRTVLVLLGIAAFWGLMRPLMLICGRILNIDGPLVSPGMRIFAWSALNTIAGYPMIVFGLRSSRLLVVQRRFLP